MKPIDDDFDKKIDEQINNIRSNKSETDRFLSDQRKNREYYKNKLRVFKLQKQRYHRLNNVKSINKLVRMYKNYPSSTTLTRYEYLILTLPDLILSLLTTENNKPSVHDLNIIDCCTAQLNGGKLFALDIFGKCKNVADWDNRCGNCDYCDLDFNKDDYPGILKIYADILDAYKNRKR